MFVEPVSQMSGVEFSTLYLARSLDRSHWAPLIICPEEGDLSAHCREDNLEIAIVPHPRFFSTSTRIFDRAFFNPLAIIADLGAIFLAARSLVKFFRARRPDLIVTKGLFAQFYGGLAARWEKIPCVWHVQDRVSSRAGPLFPRMLAMTGRSLAREVIVDAESITRQLVPIVPRERVTVIWNGADIHEFAPTVDGLCVRAEWNVRPSDLLIGVVGRLTRWKGQHILLDAFARLAPKFPNARIVLVGAALFDSDAYARELKDQAAQLGLSDRVIFAGFRWDMPQVYAALDIVAHTALEKDSSPLAVVSAMASGKPIVCARIDGTAQLFEEGNDGLLVPPGDADALANKLSPLLRDATLRQRLGQAARAKAERELSLGQFARRCEYVFARALQ